MPSHTPGVTSCTGSTRPSYDFANILLAGPCNQRCPYCIGHQIDPALNQDNLDVYPPQNLDAFLALVRQHRIQQIVLTGTNTDPQLYRYEARLVKRIRRDLPDARIALHTNGQLALAKIAVLNLYDRVTLSLPSFEPSTFAQMTGTHRMPDLAAIVRAACIPTKVSCLVDEHNVHEIPDFLSHCRELGVRRIVLRQPYGTSTRVRAEAVMEKLVGCRQAGSYRNSPVYDYQGLQVTCWDFARSTCTALNLFSDGTISSEYLLARPQSLRKIYARFTRS